MSRDDEARSTDRPPAAEEDVARDLAAAIQTAKNNTPGRYSSPAATAKIRPFELAQALALSSADGETHNASKPPRDDDAPFVPPEVEVLGEEDVPSGVPGFDSNPPKARSAPPASSKSTSALDKSSPLAAPPVPRTSYTGLAVFAVVVGLVVMAYVYMHTR